MARIQAEFRERRRFQRHLVNARVMLVHGSIGELAGRTRDISDSGVFVEITPVPRLPHGAHIKMHMLDSSMPVIAFNMKVTRTTPEGLGLLFIDYEVEGQRFSMDTLRKQFAK